MNQNTFTINQSSYHLGLVERASEDSGLSRGEIVKEGLRILWAINKNNLEGLHSLELVGRKEGVRYRSRKGTAIQARLSGVELVIAQTLIEEGYCASKSDVVKLALQAYSNVHM